MSDSVAVLARKVEARKELVVKILKAVKALITEHGQSRRTGEYGCEWGLEFGDFTLYAHYGQTMMGGNTVTINQGLATIIFDVYYQADEEESEVCTFADSNWYKKLLRAIKNKDKFFVKKKKQEEVSRKRLEREKLQAQQLKTLELKAQRLRL